MQEPSYIHPPKNYKWHSNIDYQQNPHLYRIGRGQQGVLICEPYKSYICQYWRFKTPAIAKQSAIKIYQIFLHYVKINDFVGADLAKKFLHMGFTRSRRYANHKNGIKWHYKNRAWHILSQDADALTNQKALAAEIFKDYWKRARENEKYLALKKQHKALYE